MSKKGLYTYYNDEVLYRETGHKARGTFKVSQGKFYTTIFKYNSKTKKWDNVGRSGKMKQGIKKIADKLQKNRKNAKARKENKEYNETINKVYNQPTSTTTTTSETTSITDDPLELLKQDKKALTGYSVDVINQALRDGTIEHGLVSKEMQELGNFRYILKRLEKAGILTMDKIDQKNGTGTFNSVQEYINYLFNLYKESKTPEQRTSLWDTLHSLYPEEGFSYNSLEPYS